MQQVYWNFVFVSNSEAHKPVHVNYFLIVFVNQCLYILCYRSLINLIICAKMYTVISYL